MKTNLRTCLILFLLLLGLISNAQEIFENEYSKYFQKFEIQKISTIDSLNIFFLQSANPISYFKSEIEKPFNYSLALETYKITMQRSTNLTLYPSFAIKDFFSSFKPTKRCLIIYNFHKNKKN